MKEGEYQKAESLMLHTLQQYNGTMDENKVFLLQNIAEVQSHMRKLAEAEATIRKAIALQKQSKKFDKKVVSMVDGNVKVVEFWDVSLARSLGILGGVLVKQEKTQEAEDVLEEAAGIARMSSGVSSTQMGGILNTLASVKTRKKKFQEAHDVFKESLNVAEQKYGSESRAVGVVYQNMAYNFYAAGMRDKAVVYQEKALGVLKQTLEDKHPLLRQARAALVTYNSGRSLEDLKRGKS